MLVVLLRCFSSATHEELLDEATLLAVREHFSRDGYAVVRNFASQQECDAMMARMDELVDAWDPYESHWRGDGEESTAGDDGLARPMPTEPFGWSPPPVVLTIASK